MSRESDFIGALARFAHDPAARGLADDVAVLPMGDRDLVLTHDMIVEGVHYLPDDLPEDVAWKLVAVNLSDLAAKGATPLGVMLGYPLAADAGWDAAFARGLQEACTAFAVPLLGGDTVAVPAGSARQLGLTAIGSVRAGSAPARGGAKAGDTLFVTGMIGAAGLGLAMAQERIEGRPEWLAAYRRPHPRLAEGLALAPHVNAMMDVSDGLLIDAARMAQASGLAVTIDLDAIPLPAGAPTDRAARLAAATAGDDYELLFAAPTRVSMPPDGLAAITAVGRFTAGTGLRLFGRDGPVALPLSLGYEHAP
ncbi:thiamine-phosphate kinase [Sphingomonas nostoxanthinifaciens]|uniref:thiamine-phosphate kinase n=1 Tax=Sphingomonas nostoxanthinifaciens TaxID=2872652 RepID=UPI001CC1D587|nr:thiamine-phosphate kinase [Sphingomonas nostoxanthinifaciens]UAK24984.1 thiamine-phosphate kinase [Sphingomonas nostoxanthinifaciens]